MKLIFIKGKKANIGEIQFYLGHFTSKIMLIFLNMKRSKKPFTCFIRIGRTTLGYRRKSESKLILTYYAFREKQKHKHK